MSSESPSSPRILCLHTRHSLPYHPCSPLSPVVPGGPCIPCGPRGPLGPSRPHGPGLLGPGFPVAPVNPFTPLGLGRRHFLGGPGNYASSSWWTSGWAYCTNYALLALWTYWYYWSNMPNGGMIGYTLFLFHRQKPKSRSCLARNFTFSGLGRWLPAEIKWALATLNLHQYYNNYMECMEFNSFFIWFTILYIIIPIPLYSGERGWTCCYLAQFPQQKPLCVSMPGNQPTNSFACEIRCVGVLIFALTVLSSKSRYTVINMHCLISIQHNAYGGHLGCDAYILLPPERSDPCDPTPAHLPPSKRTASVEKEVACQLWKNFIFMACLSLQKKYDEWHSLY